MQLYNLTNIESAFIQTKLDQTGISYDVVGKVITIHSPTPAQVAYVEGVVGVAVAYALSNSDEVA